MMLCPRATPLDRRLWQRLNPAVMTEASPWPVVVSGRKRKDEKYQPDQEDDSSNDDADHGGRREFGYTGTDTDCWSQQHP